MGLKNYYFKNIDARLSDSDYWDLYLNCDDESYFDISDGILSGESLVTYFDFNNLNIYTTGNTNIYSLATWTEGIAGTSGTTGITLVDIGLTGIDNGLITYVKPSGDTGNTALLSALTGSTLVLLSSDTRFWMHEVTGMMNTHVYPIELLTDQSGEYAQLCGGFYQGFYKLHGYDYQTLPNRMHKGWVVEFWLNKQDLCSATGVTLNDEYPDNKGFFFFLGTRAENKFWDIWEGLNTGATSGCTSGCTEWCTIPKEIDMTTSSGIPLDPPKLFIREIDNQFMMWNRAHSGSCGSCMGEEDHIFPDGINPCNYTASSITVTSSTVYEDSSNQFMMYNRVHSGSCSCDCSDGPHTGFTACNYTGRTHEILSLNWTGDVVNNAVGFRIKDDGSIGYRKITYTCTSESVTAATIEEAYSEAGVVQNDVWTHVAVRFISDTTLNDCELFYWKPRHGKLMFYVNGRLKFIVRDFEEVIPRELDEHKEKQQSVPYNISIGGGSQGLIDSQTFDGSDPYDENLLIEQYFAGSFIGGISQFRFYNDILSWCAIKNNYETEMERYGHACACPCGPSEPIQGVLNEDGGYILDENGNNIIND